MPLVSEQPILTVRAELGGIQRLGATPYGERRIINILGGSVEGPRLRGRILPGGADWQIVRADGVVDLRARYTVETDSGGLILVNSEGYRHGRHTLAGSGGARRSQRGARARDAIGGRRRSAERTALRGARGVIWRASECWPCKGRSRVMPACWAPSGTT